MIKLATLALLLAAAFVSPAAAQDWRLVIHGGAGTIARDRMTAEQDAEIRAALTLALETGSAVLADGGSALDAVEATIRVLEDDPNFNAGRGAVFTAAGRNELDASIMDGRTRDAGAVAGVTATRHPISLARGVMEDSPHVMMASGGADAFSLEQGLEQAAPEWFYTQERYDQLQRFLSRDQADAEDLAGTDYKFGTVGAVALDMEGNLAAGTSTGGVTGKLYGRVGDSPIIGAGTYADNGACAVSATGAGEYFIRAAVAHEICIRIRYRFREAIEEAQASIPVDETGAPEFLVHANEFGLEDADIQRIADDVMDDVQQLGGSGGVIVLTPWGNPIFSFNTAGMYRGMAEAGSELLVAIYGDE